VIKAIPQLEQLDTIDVSTDERRKVEKLSLEDLIGGGAGGQSPINFT